MYENLKINYIPGKSPILNIRNDDGSLVETIDIADYTTDGLHELMRNKGFHRSVPATPNAAAADL